jgi:hypothetical protein
MLSKIQTSTTAKLYLAKIPEFGIKPEVCGASRHHVLERLFALSTEFGIIVFVLQALFDPRISWLDLFSTSKQQAISTALNSK